jgi:hypothetical protein
MTISEIIVASCLCLWLLVSVINQFRSHAMLKLFSKYDVLKLVPSWNFFAPNPLTRDFNVLYRYRLADRQLTHWMQIRHKPDVFPLLVSTGKRLRKGLLDLCMMFFLDVTPQDKPDNAKVLSIPYLCLLNYLSGIPRSPLAEEIQYLIVLTHGADEEAGPQIVFTSHFHRLN